ncbi:MAG: MFS transporter [Rhodocyclaceae bacterium]
MSGLSFLSRLLPASVPADSLWRDRDFMRLFLATFLTVLGTAVSQMALPLTAVQNLHASATEMGILAACQLLPFVTVGLPAGVWIDRSRKRRLAVMFDLFSAAGLALVPLGAWFGFLSMPLLCVVGFVVSTTEAIGGSALQVFVTQLVGRERLVMANSRLAMASSVAFVIGPALAAVLVATLGAPMAVSLDALSFVCSAVLVGSIVHREVLAPASGASLLAQMREGLVLVWHNRVLRALVGVVAVWIILNDAFKALYVLHVTRNLGLGAGDVALINTLGALGGLAGAPLAHWLEQRRGIRDALVLGVLVAAAGYLSFAMPQADWRWSNWAAGAALFIVDCGAAIYVINYLSLRQAVTPDALLGRMVTSMRFVTILPGPLGTIALGMTADAQGVRATLLMLGAGCMAMGLAAWWGLPRGMGSPASAKAANQGVAAGGD